MLKQISNPLGVPQIRLAPRNSLEVLRIDHQDLHLALQDMKDRSPKDPRTLHCDMCTVGRFEPRCEYQQVGLHRAKGSDLLALLSRCSRADQVGNNGLLMHIQTTTASMDDVHLSPPLKV